VLDAAKKFLAVDIHDGAFGALGPHAFMRPWAGSNNWAVAPSLANGKALLATDQHLQLPNPSIFYPTHVIVAGKTDVLGVTFPGISRRHPRDERRSRMAATVSEHDVNDVFLETIAPCGAAAALRSRANKFRSSPGPRPYRSARSARSRARSPRRTSSCRITGRSSDDRKSPDRARARHRRR